MEKVNHTELDGGFICLFVRKKLKIVLRAQPSKDMWFAQGML